MTVTYRFIFRDSDGRTIRTIVRDSSIFKDIDSAMRHARRYRDRMGAHSYSIEFIYG